MLHAVGPLLLGVALLSTGCGLLLDADSRSEAGVGGDASISDANTFDVRNSDSGVPVLDATPTDATSPIDATVDSGLGCLSPVPSSDVVAHYTFDADPSSMILDEVGDHDGLRVNGVTHIDGHCGQALSFPGVTPPGIQYVDIPHHEDFHIEEGSLEFYVRVPSSGAYGIISRDENGVDEPGHFGLYTSLDGHVVVRMQDVPPMVGGHGDNAVWLCSNRPLRVGEWEHVGVSWGGDQVVQLWLDGELAVLADDLTVTWSTGGGTRSVPCGTTVRDIGIDGNSLSWILGANSNFRSTDEPEQLGVPFTGGAIDDLRILKVRQFYGRP